MCEKKFYVNSNFQRYCSESCKESKIGNVTKYNNIKKNISNKKILPKEFFNVISRGIYLDEKSPSFSFVFEQLFHFNDDVKCYIYSKLRSNYLINIIGVKDCFYISLHSSDYKLRLLGCLDYNPQRKRHYLEYFEAGTMRDNPIAMMLLNKIKRELLPFCEMEDKPKQAGKLPFEQPVKIIAISALWNKYIKEKSDLPVIKKAEEIALHVNLGPVTVCKYAKKSVFPRVRAEGGKGFNRVIDHMYNITKLWDELIKANPDLDVNKRVEEIAKQIGKDPRAIACYARDSLIKPVRIEAATFVNRSLDETHKLTELWKELEGKENYTDWLKLIKEISRRTGLSESTIVSSLQCSLDKDVKSKVIKASPLIFDQRHGITKNWITLEKKLPRLTPDEIVEKISENSSLSPSSVIRVAKSSTNKLIRKKAHKASREYDDKKYKITERWLRAKIENPILNPYEIAKILEEKTLLKSTRICHIAKASDNKIVRKEANIALKLVYDLEHYHITKNWEEQIAENPLLDSYLIIKNLEKIINLPAKSIIFYAVESLNHHIKGEAKKLEKKTMEESYKITERYKEYRKNFPTQTPDWIFTKISEDLGRNPKYVASLGKYSKAKDVRQAAYQAEKIFRGIINKRKTIEEKYPNLTIENVKQWYFKNNLSAYDIMEKVECKNVNTIYKFMEKNNINRKSYSEAMKSRWKNPEKRKKLDSIKWFESVNQKKRERRKLEHPELTVENIKMWYWKYGWSTPEIADHLEIPQPNVIYFMKIEKIERRSYSQASKNWYKNKEKKEKYLLSTIGKNQSKILNIFHGSDGMFFREIKNHPSLADLSRNNIDSSIRRLTKREYLKRDKKADNLIGSENRKKFLYTISDLGEKILTQMNDENQIMTN